MKLSELLLNRFLGKDVTQDSATPDSIYKSSNVIPDTVPSLASGSAAQDINTGNVFINGAQLEPGTYPSAVLDVANWGWGQTCSFSSTDADTVSWGSGIFKSADGTSYSISAGNTGNMSGKTYIYLDLTVSSTAYQTTTTPATAVGVGKVLVAVANPDTATATYNLSEATQIVGDNILANSINASKIIAGQLVVGTNVGIGSAFPSASAGDLAYEDLVSASLLDSTVIVGGYIKTSLLTADNIQAGTLTGRTVRTASSGTRIVIDGSANEIQIYNGSTLRAVGYQKGWNYYNSSGTEIGTIYASGSDFLIAADLTSSGNMYYGAGSSGSHSMHVGTVGSTTRFYVDDVQTWLGDADDYTHEIQAFGEMWINNGLYMDLAGSISSSGTATGGVNAGSMSVTHSSTGIYAVSHGLGTANYTVLVTVRNSTATLFAVVSGHTSSAFTVRIGDTSGTLTDAAFDFVMFLWN